MAFDFLGLKNPDGSITKGRHALQLEEMANDMHKEFATKPEQVVADPAFAGVAIRDAINAQAQKQPLFQMSAEDLELYKQSILDKRAKGLI